MVRLIERDYGCSYGTGVQQNVVYQINPLRFLFMERNYIRMVNLMVQPFLVI